jgi:hypothetical protein
MKFLRVVIHPSELKAIREMLMIVEEEGAARITQQQLTTVRMWLEQAEQALVDYIRTGGEE